MQKNDDPLIVVFANYNYLPVLENWLVSVGRVGVENFLVISLDEPLYEHLLKKKINTIYRPCELDLGKLWVHRVDVVLELLRAGCNVIHSDADAVWMKNPIKTYFHDSPYDMIFSQGTFWPKNVHEKWGFVLCCGFYYIKSNINTLKLMEEISRDVRISSDDQVSFNNCLLENGIVWEVGDETYSCAYQEVKFKCSRKIITGYNDSLMVALLPHSKFQRVSDDDNDAYIKHILSKKNTEDIVDVLKKNNCWFLVE